MTSLADVPRGAVRERPMLFQDAMVRAILSGQKTQTRRVVNPYPPALRTIFGYRPSAIFPQQDGTYVAFTDGHEGMTFSCPYGRSGDRLWVREAWRVHKDADHLPPRDLPQALTVRFEADGAPDRECGKYRPPMFMPRWACRLVLEVASVRVERLHEITEADCIAEGCPGGHGAIPGYGYHATPQEHYRWLWEQINGEGSWALNPWVWVVEFRRVP